MTNCSAESIEAVARRLAQWIKYSWDGLGSGSIVDRGYPEWAGHAYQGGQEDLRRLAAELIALSAPAQAESEPVAWRWRPRGATIWIYDPTAEWRADQQKKGADIDIEPLYAAPPQAAGEVAMTILTNPEDTWDAYCADTPGPHWIEIRDTHSQPFTSEEP